MNGPTLIAGLVVVIMLALLIRSTLKGKQSGKCGCGCSGCGGSCPHCITPNVKERRG